MTLVKSNSVKFEMSTWIFFCKCMEYRAWFRFFSDRVNRNHLSVDKRRAFTLYHTQFETWRCFIFLLSYICHFVLCVCFFRFLVRFELAFTFFFLSILDIFSFFCRLPFRWMYINMSAIRYENAWNVIPKWRTNGQEENENENEALPQWNKKISNNKNDI